jgi:hypothetical protein
MKEGLDLVVWSAGVPVGGLDGGFGRYQSAGRSNVKAGWVSYPNTDRLHRK